MRQKFFFVPAVVTMLAGAMLGACSKPESADVPEQQDTINVDHPAWDDTITITIGFGPGASGSTRGTAEDAKVSEIWLMDYVGDELKQTIHQVKDDAGFGSVQLAVVYGSHTLRIVGSAGTGASLEDGVITWTKPGDTFYGSEAVTIAPQGTKNVTLSLSRVSTRLRVSVNDEIPADFASLCIAATWYYGLNIATGEATGAQSAERTSASPASYAGTTGQLTAGFYSLCPADGYSTDVTITARNSSSEALRSISLSDVPLQRNRVTAYSGEMFQNTRSVSLDFSTDWADAFEATW